MPNVLISELDASPPIVATDLLLIQHAAGPPAEYGTAAQMATYVGGSGGLGLGTMATQNANAVAITGGTIAGITDLAVADGGTGASTASGARTNLGLGTVAVQNTGASGANVPLLNGANTWSGEQTYQSTTNLGGVTAAQVINLTSGQIKFPASQLASSDPNTLDDYEEGTATLSMAFGTPGDLAVTYALRTAFYVKVGAIVSLHFALQSSAFTYTTANGNFTISGLPFTSESTGGNITIGALLWGGVTKVNFTSAVLNLNNGSTSSFVTMSGSSQAATQITTTEVASGGTVNMRGTLVYHSA